MLSQESHSRTATRIERYLGLEATFYLSFSPKDALALWHLLYSLQDKPHWAAILQSVNKQVRARLAQLERADREAAKLYQPFE